MFKQLSILFLASFALSLMAAPLKYPTEEESKAELKSAGMTESSINGLAAFTQRFATGYPIVQADKQKADKFISDYTNDVQNFIKAMSPEDQKIYNNYLVKYGLA